VIHGVGVGDMEGQNKQWWKGLGIELETDIETFNE